MNETFASNLLSQGSIEQECLSKNIKNVRFEVFNKNKISVLDFSTESAELQNQQLITCYSHWTLFSQNLDEKVAP